MVRRAQWERPLDTPKLIVTLILLALLIILMLRLGSCGGAVTAPAFLSPAGGVILAPDALTAFEGTAAPGAKLRIYNGDKLLGETTADAGGKWSFKLAAALGEGSHNLRVSAVDDAGKELAASPPLALNIALPALPAVVPAFNVPAAGASLAPDALTAFEGTAAPGAKLRIYNGDKLLGETTADAGGKWSFKLAAALGEGSHNLRVSAVDDAGKELAASPPLAIGILKAATVPVLSLAEGRALAPGDMLTGTADPGARLMIYDGDKLLGEATAGPDGKWQFKLPADLTSGRHRLRVVAVGAAGETLAEAQPADVEIVELRLPVTGGASQSN